MQEESEEFLSLEDQSDSPIEVKKREPKKPISKTLKPLHDSVIPENQSSVDMQIVGEYSGKQTISWPIQDMDCPHCASEAMKRAQ